MNRVAVIQSLGLDSAGKGTRSYAHHQRGVAYFEVLEDENNKKDA